ncbi:Hypothetical protein MexAM1_META1p4030 [Methylorubrum extorquens AM1]|uniref:Uncharacterized protein n=1 Tax=Methylorubrum extorquens (strain ATCC 14718 / DSM 1338 / JCM 2805 / NCIMB 9133 / AM1) TaxID=272630 RepID=C5B1A3_METEA|nr:Hypothetical protein MexAM1_META1p4030 [Methylorubrum extorquens AM1]
MIRCRSSMTMATRRRTPSWRSCASYSTGVTKASQDAGNTGLESIDRRFSLLGTSAKQDEGKTVLP